MDLQSIWVKLPLLVVVAPHMLETEALPVISEGVHARGSCMLHLDWEYPTWGVGHR